MAASGRAVRSNSKSTGMNVDIEVGIVQRWCLLNECEDGVRYIKREFTVRVVLLVRG